jgi:1,4-alpha-glucan branching enzyme
MQGSVLSKGCVEMIKKEYTKTGRSCRVTFSLPRDIGAEKISVVGDFNEWDPEAAPLKRGKNGSFKATISLKPGTTYRFRYLLDNETWENDSQADGYAPNPYGGDDSLLEI